MVVVRPANTIDLVTVPCELRLNSTRSLRFLAPVNVDMQPAENTITKRKSSGSDDQSDLWEGVTEMCQALDDMMEIDKDTELLADKSILEIGYTTGLPSVLALASGAADVTIHSWTSSMNDFYVKPTMRRNNVPRSRCKTSASAVKSCLQSLRGKTYDVILAPELLATDEEEFAELHDVLVELLKPEGIVLILSRTYYAQCSGSLQAFLDLCKQKNQFDAHIRWNSTKSDLAPRKMIQLTRMIR